MGHLPFEYRFRTPLYILIFAIGFWPAFAPLAGLPPLVDWLGFTAKSTWLVLSMAMAHQGWLGFGAATSLLLVIAILFCTLGTWLRVWGAAYRRDPIALGANTEPRADGPYRRSRHPMLLGLLLHTVGITLLTAPAMAVFTIAAVWILAVRLAIAEEDLLGAQYGKAYISYEAKVPRFLPAPTPQVAPLGARGQWGWAALEQVYFLGVVFTLVIAGWDFNALPLLKGILISLGLSFVAQALKPRAQGAKQVIGTTAS